MGTALRELPWTNILTNRAVAADQHINDCNFLSMSCSMDSGEVGNSMIQYLDNLTFLTFFSNLEVVTVFISAPRVATIYS